MSMHLTLMGGGASRGLPRQGLVALYDPYRDAYGLDATARAALQTGVDYSGNGNTLTYGETTNASTDDPSNTGTAWSFDGGDYLMVTSTAKCVITGAFTLTAVVSWSTSPSGYARIIGKENLFGFYIREGSKTLRFYGNINGASVDTYFGANEATPEIPPSTPTVISVTYNGSALYGYANGLCLGSKNYSGAVASEPGRYFMLGNRVEGDRGLVGSIYMGGLHSVYSPPARQMNTYRYLKSIMASRGVTVA
jgi:hypothetical protein